MNRDLLTESDIANWCGYKRQGDIERWLKENGIRYFRGKDGKLLATIGLVEAAKLQGPANDVEFL